MKIIQQLLSGKISRYIVGVLIILFLISDWISNRPETKTIRQVGSSSDYMQILWTRKMYLWDYIADWNSNMLYVVETGSEKLLAIDSLTGASIWEIPLNVPTKSGELNEYGVRYLLAVDRTVFSVTSTSVNAYRASTGELLWSTKIGDGHVAIRAQYDGSLIRVYYGEELIEISKKTGEILTRQPMGDIVWIQNNVEIHCPLRMRWIRLFRVEDGLV
jgi:outer membrane protein assembly factor BamB